MTRYDRRSIALAIALSGLAGYVDAIGFLSLGNFFVSFMSGNSTRLAIALSEGRVEYGLLAIGVIALFVLGVIAGTLVSARYPDRRRRAVLLLVASLLAVASVLHALGFHREATAAMLLAMGAENAVFQEGGEVSVGLTYMTGTLVKLGQRIAALIRGDRTRGWLPYALLWLGLVVGGTLGALAHAAFATGGLWLGAAVALVLALVPKRQRTSSREDSLESSFIETDGDLRAESG